MVTDALMSFVAWLVETVTGWFPTTPPPAWLGDPGGTLQTVVGHLGSMGVWIPVPLALQVAGAVLLCVVIGFTIKLVRSVASYFLAGGGSSG